MITEDQLEQLAIQWFQDTGWTYVHGAVIAPEAEPKGPSPRPSPTGRGGNTSEREEDCRVVDHALLIDFEYPSRNDFLVVSQFRVAGKKKPRRPDLVCFVNGLPLRLIELKNPADQQANVWKAFDQLQTYQAEISDLLVFNQALVVSDGMNARVRLGVTATLAEASVHSIHSTKALKISANDLAPARMTLATRRGELRSTETMNGPWGSRHVLLKTWPTGFPCPIRGAERS